MWYVLVMSTDQQDATLDVVRRRYEGLQLMVTSIRQAVDDAREAGVPWDAVGEVFGVPADEARAMFGGDDDPRGGSPHRP